VLQKKTDVHPATVKNVSGFSSSIVSFITNRCEIRHEPSTQASTEINLAANPQQRASGGYLTSPSLPVQSTVTAAKPRATHSRLSKDRKRATLQRLFTALDVTVFSEQLPLNEIRQLV